MLSSLIASPPDFKSSVMPGPLMTASQFLDVKQFDIEDVPFCFSDSPPAVSPRVINIKECLKSLFASKPQHSDHLNPNTPVLDLKDYFSHPVSPQSDGSFSGHSTDSERCSPAHSICSLSPEHSMDGIEDIDLHFGLDSISENCELLSCLDRTCDEVTSPNSVLTNEHSISNIQSMGRSISSGLSNQDFNPIFSTSSTLIRAESPSRQFLEGLDNDFADEELNLAFHELMQAQSDTCTTYLPHSPVFSNTLNSNEQLADEFINHHDPNFILPKDDYSVSPFGHEFLDVDSKPVLPSSPDSEIPSYSNGFSTEIYTDKSPLINNWSPLQKRCMDMSECNDCTKSNEEALLVKTNAVAYNKILKTEPVDTDDTVEVSLSRPYLSNDFLSGILGSKVLELPKDSLDSTEGCPDSTEDIPDLIPDIPDLTTDIPDLPTDILDLARDVPVLPKIVPASTRTVPDMSLFISVSSSPSESVKCDHCYTKSEFADTPIKLEVDVIPDYSEELMLAPTPVKRRPGRPRKVIAGHAGYRTKVMAPKATNLKKHKRSLPPPTKRLKLQNGSSVRTDRREQHNKAERLRRYAIKESMFIVASKCPEYIFYATQSALQSSKSSRCEEIENNFTVEVLRKIDEIIKKGELENKRYKYKKATNYSKMVMLLGVTYFVSNLEKELKAKENQLKLSESVLRHTVNRPAKRTKRC